MKKTQKPDNPTYQTKMKEIVTRNPTNSSHSSTTCLYMTMPHRLKAWVVVTSVTAIWLHGNVLASGATVGTGDALVGAGVLGHTLTLLSVLHDLVGAAGAAAGREEPEQSSTQSKGTTQPGRRDPLHAHLGRHAKVVKGFVEGTLHRESERRGADGTDEIEKEGDDCEDGGDAGSPAGEKAEPADQESYGGGNEAEHVDCNHEFADPVDGLLHVLDGIGPFEALGLGVALIRDDVFNVERVTGLGRLAIIKAPRVTFDRTRAVVPHVGTVVIVDSEIFSGYLVSAYVYFSGVDPYQMEWL